MSKFTPEQEEAALRRICIGGREDALSFFARHPRLGHAVAIQIQCEADALRATLTRIVSDFESDYVLDGQVVDDPTNMHRKAWELAKAALKEYD